MRDKQIINRYFSESFRQSIVKDLDSNVVSIAEVSREYGVSRTSIYRWLYKYSKHHERSSKQVVELKSEANKTKQLKERIAELEQALGRKQLELDYFKKLAEVAQAANEKTRSKKKTGR